MALRTFHSFGNAQDGTPHDFGIGNFASIKVLPLSSGGWVVVGKSSEGPNQGSLVAQTFNAAGEAIGAEAVLYRAADLPAGRDNFGLADAVLLTDGKLALSISVIENNGQFTSFAFDVYTRVFTAGGFAPLGPAVQADTGQDGQEYAGAIAALPDGGFAVIWRDAYTSHDGTQRANGTADGGTYAESSDMWIRAFNGDGSPRAQAYLAQGTSDPDLAYPQGAYAQDLEALSGGRLVTAFSDTELRSYYTDRPQSAFFDGDSFHLSTSTGAPAGVADDASIGAFFTQPPSSTGNFEGASNRPVQIVATAGGGFVAVFSERYVIRGDYGSIARTEYYLKAQAYDANGAAVGAEKTLDYLADDPLAGTLSATLMSDGRIAVAYTREFGHYPTNDAGIQLLTLAADLSVSSSARLAAPGFSNVYGLSQDADGALLVTYGGGAPDAIARVVDAAAGAVVQVGTSAGESLDGSAQADWIDGGAGNDLIHGQAGADHLYGRAGDDQLFGEDGADVLFGGDGADVLVGGAGADILTGGAGADSFLGTRADMAGDLITDLRTGDLIDVTDAAYASFAYGRLGSTLTIGSGQAVTLGGAPNVRLVLSADSGGGVLLTAAAHVAGLNDFNGDGHSDLLWRNTNSGTFTTWQISGNTTGNQEQPNAYINGAVDSGWRIQGTMDFNSDGASDIVWRNTASGQFTVWNSSGGAFSQNSYVGSVGTDWTLAALADFNGDGRDDLIWRQAGGTFTEWTSTGNGFVANSYINGGVGNDWKIIGTGDFNGDGRADLLWRNTGGTFTEWLSTGTGFTENAYVDGGVSTAWHIMAVGDFNGDGKDDLLWRNDNGVITEWQSTGSGFNANVYVNGGVANDWRIQGVFDFNDDGRADILWRNSSGVTTIWQSTGSGFTENTVAEGRVGSDWQLITHQYDFV